MTSGADLTALIEKIERATGPSRILDADISLGLKLPIPFSADDEGAMVQKMRDVPLFTKSLDAAMTLVPENADWELSRIAEIGRPSFEAIVYLVPFFSRNADTARVLVEAHSGPLALTAACLKAKLAEGKVTTMTPIEAAIEEFSKCDGQVVNEAIERACQAYVRALVTDEATVEHFAKLADPRVFASDAYDCHPDWRFPEARAAAKAKARAALSALLPTPEVMK